MKKRIAATLFLAMAVLLSAAGCSQTAGEDLLPPQQSTLPTLKPTEPPAEPTPGSTAPEQKEAENPIGRSDTYWVAYEWYSEDGEGAEGPHQLDSDEWALDLIVRADGTARFRDVHDGLYLMDDADLYLTWEQEDDSTIRALYRASAYGKVAIMFPMITSVWEVKECKRACRRVMAELDKEGIPYRRDTEIGIMIETPASVLVAEELAKEVDFFSVGTNDLTQYTLACDRQANDLGKFFDPHHPAVLRALKIAADAAHKAGIWIGICGELGADLTMLETFLAIGIDELSVSPSSVLPLRAEIRKSIAKTCTLERLEC